MKEITLTQGMVALVDDVYYEHLNQYTWCAWETSPGNFYAGRKDPTLGTVYMHRYILGLQGKEHGDHIDGNKLNNQEANLRKATSSQNGGNSKMSKNNTSGFKGVVWNSKNKNWNAQIKVNYKVIFLGVHKTAEAAARTYDNYAKKSFGEFAKLNFPELGETTL